MDSQRFRRAREVFETAVELDDADRGAYLDRACDTDDDLRRRVEALLARDSMPSDPMGGAIRGALLDFHDSPSKVRHPERIGSYAVLGEIGQGGMGVVYRARDPRLERDVALKVLPDELGRNAAGLARFRREAQLLAAINHPGIATIYSLEEAGGVHFLTMELIDGESLRSRLDGEPLRVDEALSLCREIATAVEVAHRNEIVHRDLKPVNVMINDDGRVKVLDFGLAKSSAPADDVTLPGTIAGTPGYMSPEQLRGESVAYAADVWSFGCVLYECLTGAPAFPGESPSDRIAATLRGGPDWELLPPVSDGVRELLVRCFAADAADRIGSMHEVVSALAEATAGHDSRRLRSAGASREPSPDNLPVHLSSFVGRKDMIAGLHRLLGVNRLVTLTGPGGAGKTRLAVQVAREEIPNFADGVWLAELAPLTEPELVPRAVATVLGVKGEGARSRTQALVDALSGKSLLLILDNCEHVLSVCSELSEALLLACPGVRIVATSREKLGITGEINFRVPSLDLPPSTPVPLEELAEIEAVRLFLERADAERGGLGLVPADASSVVSICRRLDGIPLALELAAARVRVLPLSEIAKRLDDRFRLLTGGNKSAMPQHRTLRALIDWSHDLLGDPEKRLLRRLSVFAGGWTLAAAESVCMGDAGETFELHSNLVDKSLVEMDPQGSRATDQPRYRMLETVRSYAAERLADAGETEETLVRHRDFYLALAERAYPELTAAGQATWYSRLSAEHENLRLALDACTSPADPEAGVRLAGALGQYWDACGHFGEGRRALARALARAPTGRTAARGLALEWAGWLAYRQADYPEAIASFTESGEIRGELSDDEGVATSLGGLGSVAETRGRDRVAADYFQRSLEIFRKLGRRHRVAAVLHQIGALAIRQLECDRGRPLLEESLQIRRELENTIGVIASLNSLGELALYERKYDEARSRLEESLEIATPLGERHSISYSLHGLGRIAEQAGDLSRAHALLRESLGIRWSLRDRFCSCSTLLAFAALAIRAGELPRSALLLAAVERLLEEIRATMNPANESIRQLCLNTLRAELPPDELERAWSRGRSMSLEQVVEYARREEDTYVA